MMGSTRSMTKTREHFSKLMNAQTLGQPFHHDEVRALLLHHPYHDIKIKPFGELMYLVIRHEPVYKTRCLYMKLSLLDEELDVSWRDCVSHLYGKFDKAKIHEACVVAAFRNTIWDKKQRQSYLAVDLRQCVVCQRDDVPLSMDHYPTPFQKILDLFLQERQLLLREIQTTSDGIQHFLTDNVLAEQWVKHHDAIAEFRVLCTKCNSRNGSYGYRRSIPFLEA